jgi:hypothetical protein
VRDLGNVRPHSLRAVPSVDDEGAECALGRLREESMKVSLVIGSSASGSSVTVGVVIATS